MKRVKGFAAAAGLTMVCGAILATPAHADRLSLAIGPGEDAARMSADGAGYRLSLPLTLRANIPAEGEGLRITGARLVVKDEGQEATAAAARVPVGASTWTTADTFTFDAAAQGPLAQNANAACAAQPGSGLRRASMLVPVVWHVTTGRFGFVRLAAGGLQPDAGMLSDADFYGDKQEEQVEAAIAVTIECPPETAPRVAANAPAPVAPKASAKAKPKVEMAAVTPAPQSPAPAAETSGGVQAFACEGGMVRETLAGPGHEVCLCPGNTARRQTGERSYVCEKRFARKR